MTDERSEPMQLSGSEATQEPRQEVSAEEQARKTLEALQTVGVESPEQVQNLQQAAQQAGHVQNLLGQANQRIRELEAALAQGRPVPQQPSPHRDKGVSNSEYAPFHQRCARGSRRTLGDLKQIPVAIPL